MEPKDFKELGRKPEEYTRRAGPAHNIGRATHVHGGARALAALSHERACPDSTY